MSEWALKTFEKYERARLMEALENQPPEVMEEAFIARRADEEEAQRQARIWAALREGSNLSELLAQSDDNTLRRVGGAWVPNRKGSTDGN